MKAEAHRGLLAMTLALFILAGIPFRAGAAPVDGGAEDAPGNDEVSTVSVMLPVVGDSGMFNYILDPELLISRTGGVRYPGYTFTDARGIYFCTDYNTFSSRSGNLHIENTGTADVNVTLSIVALGGTVNLVPREQLGDGASRGLYLGLVVIGENEVQRPIVRTITEREQTMTFALRGSGSSSAIPWTYFDFYVEGEADQNGDWTAYEVPPTFQITWSYAEVEGEPEPTSIVEPDEADVAEPQIGNITSTSALGRVPGANSGLVPWVFPTPSSKPVATPASGPVPEPSVEPTAEPEPETSAEPTPEPDPEASAEPTPEPDPEASAEPTSEPDPEASAEPTLESDPDTSVEPTSEPDLDTSAEPTSEPEPETSAEPKPEPDLDAGAEPAPEPAAEPDETYVEGQAITFVTSGFSVSGVYTGGWKDGKPYGEGTLTITESGSYCWSCGDVVWSQFWIDGLIEGYGEWRSVERGLSYSGNFSAGLEDGYGKLLSDDGTTIYEGQWSGGVFVG